MVFNKTNGKKAKYLVSVYRWSFQDRHYFNNYKEAKECFEELRKSEQGEGTIVSLYDMIKDIRKEFARVGG